MPNLHGVRSEIQAGHNRVRTDYARQLNRLTGRNVILYYSGWLQKPTAPNLGICDLDISWFMSVIHGLEEPESGLDLLLHTPGGEVAATESLVRYLRGIFGTDLRVLVPQLAMSADTVIACAAKSVVMGKHSSLGPIDPQINGMSAHGICREFQRAHEEIKVDPSRAHVWLPIISQYPPSLVGQCEQWVEWANDMALEWLETGMFADDPAPRRKAEDLVGKLADTAETKFHDRHFSADYCRRNGMKVEMMEGEENQNLQDAILSLHHACMLTLLETPASKIIGNHIGMNFMQSDNPP